MLHFHRTAACLAFVLAACIPLPVSAQWASIGEMPAPVREGNTLTFKNRQAVVTVSLVAPEIVRIRFSPGVTLGRDHSYAVVSKDFEDPGARFVLSRNGTTIDTAALRVTISHRPFRIAVFTPQGEPLDQDDAAMGMAFSGRRYASGSGCDRTNRSMGSARRTGS